MINQRVISVLLEYFKAPIVASAVILPIFSNPDVTGSRWKEIEESIVSGSGLAPGPPAILNAIDFGINKICRNRSKTWSPYITIPFYDTMMKSTCRTHNGAIEGDEFGVVRKIKTF